ncbi:helix-turn-helix domain-containing protein [Kribbella antibiotica]|uniref:helix-turn-helix domain-containing protein n=1 Tax=Kribbella antibiotica TaxID=190195 RepID=UPI0014050A93|nr:helix-turn-helix transcriptional regulator [Kribbella antibiotica]
MRQLRLDAGLSQIEAAAATGLTQAKISRLENGRYTPQPEDVKQLARAYQASPQVRQELEQTASDLSESRVYSRIVLQRGAWRMQQQAGRIEKASARVRAFHPTLVPGLLQTPAYARAMFASVGVAGEELERTVQARIDRQALLGADHDFTLLLTEGALRWQVTSPSLMVEQIEHISRSTQLSNVRVGLIPFSRPTGIFVQEGFDLYDAQAVIIGTTTATATITDDADVAVYDQLFSELESLAVYDYAARRELDRIAEDYRLLPNEPVRR